LDNNDLLRRLRYALRCDDARTSHLIQLGGGSATTAQAARWRLKESEPEFSSCSAEMITRFLDGLILELRGPKDEPAASPWPARRPSDKQKNDKPKQVEPAPASDGFAGAQSQDKATGTLKPDKLKAAVQMDNNLVLKQLRIALSLRSDDVHAILKDGGSALSASEAGALFRKPEARNFRQCGDQVLRQFIAGLVVRRERQSAEKN